MRFRAFLALQLGVLLVSESLTGCTLVGMGVGAGIDAMIPGPYEARDPAERVQLESGKRVEVGVANGRRVRGRYVGTHGPTARDPETYLLVDGDEGVVSIPASEVRMLGVEVLGKGWIYGGVVGFIVDVCLVVLFVSAYDNMKLGQNVDLGLN